MEIERSCGAVVFTKENKDYRFVIIQSLEGTYGFPKGHMKDYETERQTAMREVREETGILLKEVSLFMIQSGNKMQLSYPNGDVTDYMDLCFIVFIISYILCFITP